MGDQVYTVTSSEVIIPKDPGPSRPVEVFKFECSKCSKVYRGMRCLQKHLDICGQPDKKLIRKPRKRKSDEDLSPTPKVKTSEEITKAEPQTDEEDENSDAPVEVLYEDKPQETDTNLCFCCDEPVANNHNGHVRCKFCKKSFASNAGREKHMTNLHNSIEDFPCPKCKAQCISADILKKHIASHVGHVCKNCGGEFSRQYHLDRHQSMTKCGSAEKEHSCEVCGKSFTRVDNLRVHLRSHIGADSKTQKCTVCDKTIKGSMSLHMRSHTGEKPFPCDICPKTFISNGALAKHRRVHTGERPYECSYCLAKFAAKETLNRHVKVHTGAKNYQCPECGIAFIQRTQLKSHMFHHTGDNGHKCPHCDETFDSKPTLVRHLDAIHDSAKKCPNCVLAFATEEDLKAHQDSVHLMRKYVCEECSIEFEMKSDLTAHLTSCGASKEKLQPTMSCAECGKTFKRFDLLDKHQRTAHVPTDATPKKRGRPRKVVSPEVKSEQSQNEVFNQLKNSLDATFNTGESSHIDDKPVVYSSEKSLQKVFQKILMGFLNADILKKVGWPWRGVVGTLERVLQVIGVEFHDDEETTEEPERLRNMMLALLGKFVDDESITNNYTVDQILRFMETSLEKRR